MALNEAIKAFSPFKSFKELKATPLIRDYKTAKSNGDDFLKTYCGMITLRTIDKKISAV
ncbi:MAG: hypothetical protein SR1Q5_06780 [Quinella sp. 1Q5]|nr:hypothetical protein [Quinella sp. 1Q5]